MRKKHVIPRRYKTKYRVDGRQWRASWWSWMGKIYFHQARPVDLDGRVI